MVVPTRKGPRRDDGYFGPDSVTWQVVGHPAINIGNARSAVVAMLSSEVAQSIKDTDVFHVDPARRAEESNYWVFTSVFGDTAEARRAGKFVQGKHSRVSGTDPVSGTEYSPSRPDLAIAGHGLIWEANLAAYETYVRRLDDTERNRYWQEGFAAANLLGIDVDTLPQTFEDWRTYYRSEIYPKLNYSVAAEENFQNLRNARYAPAWARPLVKIGVAAAEQLTLATFTETERALLGGTHSATRVAITRLLGRELVRIAALPPIRDLLERATGGANHTLLAEARDIRRRHRRAHTAAPAAGKVA